MSQRHYISVDMENRGTVYRKQILGNDVFADEQFYKNLDLGVDWGNHYLQRVEVDFERFILEWWRFLSRTIEVETEKVNLELDFNQEDDTLLFHRLWLNRNTAINQFYITLNELLNYTNGFNLRKHYKLYIEVF